MCHYDPNNLYFKGLFLVSYYNLKKQYGDFLKHSISSTNNLVSSFFKVNKGELKEA